MNSYFIERPTCPCCGGVRCERLYECPFDADPIRQYLTGFYGPAGGVGFEYLKGASFILERCAACHLLFQRQVGNDFLLRQLYDGSNAAAAGAPAATDNQGQDLWLSLKYAREITSVLAHLGTAPAQTRCFDFGMGWGGWCRMAMAFGCPTYGAELSAARLQCAQAQGIQIVAWEKIPEHRFDFIHTEQVFEHLPQPRTTLQHLARALAPAGLLKIAVPPGNNVPRLLKNPDWRAPKGHSRSLNAAAPLEHINCFDYRALTVLGQQAGLQPVEIVWETLLTPRRHLSRRLLGPFKALPCFLRRVLPAFFAGRFRRTSIFFQRAAHVEKGGPR